MKIKLRTRVNDISLSNKKDCEFIHFDNCTEVETGKRKVYLLDVFESQLSNNTWNYLKTIGEIGTKDSETYYMTRSYYITKNRLKDDNSSSKPPKDSPFHFNIISWKDRISGKRCKIIFDTVAFLQNDQGDTLEKIEG